MEDVRILIIEDNAEVRKSIRKMISSTKLATSIFEAEDSKAAMLMLTEKKPVITLLDLNLNGENGIYLIPEIKNNHGSKIIVLSNESSSAIRKKCLSIGADYFLDKSLEFDKVCSSINNLLKLEDVLS